MRKLHAFPLAVLAAVFVGFLVAQGSVAQRPVSERAMQHLTEEVRRELGTLPYYTVFDHLEFRVDGRTVTLDGHVTQPTLKSDAEAAVWRIEGVERVVNQIAVLPPSPMDDQIRIAAYYALFGQDSSLMRYGVGAQSSIRIIVNNSRVTLEGIVSNRADSYIATARVRSIPGILSVTNNLRVEG